MYEVNLGDAWASLPWDGAWLPINTPMGLTVLGWGIVTPINTPVGPTSLGWGHGYP